MSLLSKLRLASLCALCVPVATADEQVQVDIDNPACREATGRTAALWKRVMKGWLKTARRGDVFPFRVELGPPDYAILDANGREPTDHWEQQKAMKALAERLWNEAVAETGVGQPHGKGP